jgi:hypothetical protein
MRLRAQIPAGLPLQAPVRLRVQVPVRLPLQSPARLRLASPVAGPAGTLIPAPRIRVAAGQPVPAAVLTPRALRLHVRPTRVRVRFRIPAIARIQVLPGELPRPRQVVIPGPRPAAVIPAGTPAPVRLRIVFQKGVPVPARLVLPASLPGQARLRIRLPARARIQVPARARILKALPAPPNW